MKPLKLVAIILTLIVVSELGFYFYIVKVTNYKDKNSSQQPIISPKPTLPKDFTAAIHPDQIKTLSQFVKNERTNEKYYLMIENEGILTDINRKGKKIGNTIFPLGIKIKSGQIESWEWLSPKLYESVQVFVLNNGNLQKMSLNDLKIGDHIITQHITNLAYPPFDPRNPHSFIIKIIK